MEFKLYIIILLSTVFSKILNQLLLSINIDHLSYILWFIFINFMETYQKKKRLIHVKSVQSIMRRQNNNKVNTLNHDSLNKSYRITKITPSMTNSFLKKFDTNVDQCKEDLYGKCSNVTVISKTVPNTINRQSLKKYEIQKENLNLAKRIAESNPTINHEKLDQDWKMLQSYLKVRSNFKKNINVVEPRIFKLQKMIGFGSIQYKFTILKLTMEKNFENPKYIYYLIFKFMKRKFKSRLFSFFSLLSEQFRINVPKSLESIGKFSVRIMQIKGTQEYDQGKFKVKLKQQTQNIKIQKNTKIQNGNIIINIIKQE